MERRRLVAWNKRCADLSVPEVIFGVYGAADVLVCGFTGVAKSCPEFTSAISVGSDMAAELCI
jgi:hypothetical protein